MDKHSKFFMESTSALVNSYNRAQGRPVITQVWIAYMKQ